MVHVGGAREAATPAARGIETVTLYHLSVFLHVMAALVWLGGIFFLALVAAPVLRRVDPPHLRARLFRELGERFRWVGWGAIGVLLVTGGSNLHFRGLLSREFLGDPAFWSGTPYGRALGWKLFFVITMLLNQGLHDFWLGPAAGRVDPGNPKGERLRRWAGGLARANGVIALLLVYVAIRLARGG